MKHNIMYKAKQAAKIALVSFPLIINNAYAGFLDDVKKDIDRKVNEGKKTVDSYKEKAREDYKRKKEETQRKYHEEKRKAGDYYEDKSRELHETYETKKEETRRSYEDKRRKAGDYYEDKSRELHETYERKREETETFVREGGIERTIDNIEKIKDETTITVIKNIPVYDPKDGQLKSYDSFIRENFNKGTRGTSLEDDPVRGAYYLYNDPDYLMNAKIISTDKGFISINESLRTGIRKEEAQRARNSYYNMRTAYNNNNTDNLNRYSNQFNKSVSELGVNRGHYRVPLKETDFEDIGRRIKDTKAYDIYKSLDGKLTDFYTEKLDLGREASELASKLTIFIGMPILFFWTLGKLRRKKHKDEIDEYEEDEYDKEPIKPKEQRIKSLVIKKAYKTKDKIEEPLSILKLRLAKGEINLEEYEGLYQKLGYAKEKPEIYTKREMTTEKGKDLDDILIKDSSDEERIKEPYDDIGVVKMDNEFCHLEQGLTSRIHRAITIMCIAPLLTIGGIALYHKNNNIKKNPVRIESNTRNLESLINNINSRIVKEPKYNINLLKDSETYHDLDNDGINEEISFYHGYTGNSESSTTFLQINNHSKAVVIAGMNMKNNNHTIILQECFIGKDYCDSSYTRRLKYNWDGERLKHERNGYRLQTSSKETISEAIKEAERIRNEGFEHTYVYSKEIKGKTWYAVYIGPFKSKSDALLTQTVYYEMNPYAEESIVRRF